MNPENYAEAIRSIDAQFKMLFSQGYDTILSYRTISLPELLQMRSELR